LVLEQAAKPPTAITARPAAATDLAGVLTMFSIPLLQTVFAAALSVEYKSFGVMPVADGFKGHNE